MSMYTLNAEEFGATYNALNKATNQNIIAAMQELAGILKAHEGESDVIDQAIANCHTLADNYNQGFCESLTKLDQLFDLSEFMAKKANIGDVSKVDTGFEAGKLDASGVMV